MKTLSWKEAIVLGLTIAVSVGVILLATNKNVSITWDEPIYIESAERAMHWLGLVVRGQWQQAFEPQSFGISWGLNHEHPPLMRIVQGVAWGLSRSHVPPPLSHRLGAILFAAGGLGAIAALIVRERGACIALFTTAAILTMPRLFFHAHLAALDFPIAIMWLLTTLVFYRVMKTPPLQRTPWTLLRRSFILGFLLGLALLTKINAVLLMPFWALWLLVNRRLWRNMVMWLLSLPVALVVLVAGWPWLWKNTLSGLLTWEEFFRIHYSIPQWFGGHLYVDNTPWWLPLAILIITTPILLLLLAGLGLWQRRQATLKQAQWFDLHLLGMTVILVWFALPGSHLHDSDRLLLPAFFHLAVLSAEGFNVLWLGIERRLGRWRRVLRQDLAQGLLASLLLVPGIHSIAHLHPFELAYYNGLAGGVAGAQRLGLESIYFASTYGYFLPELNTLPAGSRIWVMPNSYDVLYYYQRNGLLRADLIMLRPPGWGSFYDDEGVLWAEGWIDQADYALIERRQSHFNTLLPNHDRIVYWAESHRALKQLQRDGVILSGLYARQP